MPAAYSIDLREKAIAAYERGERKSTISRTFDISRNTLDQWLKRRRETGTVAPKTYRRGPKPKIQDLDKFKVFVQDNGDLTQEEMAQKWSEQSEPVSQPLIGKALQKIEYTRKKKSYKYKERDEEERAAFQEKIKRYAPERFVYVDEAGVDDTIDYEYGYAHKSERYHAEKRGHKTQRISFVSGWWRGSTIAPLMFEGYCNSQLICTWVEECLVPELIPGQIVFFDNASFHPKRKIEELVSQAGCEVIFLPKYSPDLNKIEKFWARLKHQIKKLKREMEDLGEAIKEAFRILS